MEFCTHVHRFGIIAEKFIFSHKNPLIEIVPFHRKKIRENLFIAVGNLI